jgi:hypothetical protein
MVRFCQVMLVWPRVQLLSGADGLPEHPRQVLLLRANNLVVSAIGKARLFGRAIGKYSKVMKREHLRAA